MSEEERLTEEEVSEELRRVRKEMPKDTAEFGCERMPMPTAQVVDYEPGSFDRTGLGVGGADPPEANQQPSEMDVKKPACAEGWIGELSFSSLCKVSSTGDLFPFPLDSFVNHPSLPEVDSGLSLVVKGLLRGLNHVYGCEASPDPKMSAAQVKVCMFLIEVAKNFLFRCPALPEMTWEDYLRVKTIDYKGDEVKVAQMTSWSNLKSALPAEVGTVPLESVVSRGSQHYVLNFDSYLIPEVDQVHTKPPRVMVPDGEREDLCRGLLTKGICGLIREDQIYRVKGKPLFNGFFGVPKDEMDGTTPVHRLIMNLIPLNRICRPMSGDVSTLPAWPSMHPFEIGENQTLMVSSEDVRCFFYIFSVPVEWHRFLAFGRRVPQALCPGGQGHYFLCSRVLPMGFCNSVSLAQHIHRNIVGEAVKECVAKGVRAGWEAEHRKDRPFSWSNPSYRVYLDNFDLMEKCDSTLAEQIRETTSDFVEALQEVYARRHVPRHPKAFAEVQGAEIDGRTGFASPKAEKIGKYIQLCQLLLDQGRCTQRQAQVVAGGFVVLSVDRCLGR